MRCYNLAGAQAVECLIHSMVSLCNAVASVGVHKMPPRTLVFVSILCYLEMGIFQNLLQHFYVCFNTYCSKADRWNIIDLNNNNFKAVRIKVNQLDHCVHIIACSVLLMLFHWITFSLSIIFRSIGLLVALYFFLFPCENKRICGWMSVLDTWNGSWMLF